MELILYFLRELIFRASCEFILCCSNTWWCLHAFRVTATAGKASELKQRSQFRIVSKSHKCHMWLQISHLITLSHTLYLPDQPRQADLQGWFIPKRAKGHRFYSWLRSETSVKSLFPHHPDFPAAEGGQHLLGSETWLTALDSQACPALSILRGEGQLLGGGFSVDTMISNREVSPEVTTLNYQLPWATIRSELSLLD